MQLTEHITEEYVLGSRQRSAYSSLLFRCLWTNNSTTVSDSSAFIDNYFSDFCASLHTRETGILEKDGKIGLFSVPTIEYRNEAQLAELISAHTHTYPALKLRTVAAIILHRKAHILDEFSLKEKLVIIGYLIGESKDELNKTYAPIDIQKCIDRLWHRIISM